VGKFKLTKRASLLAGAIAVLSLALAPAAAMAAAPSPPPYSVSLTYFGGTVSGVAPAAATGVTVTLLRTSTIRNPGSASGSAYTIWNTVGTFTATPATGAWTGSFPAGTTVLPGDEVEVKYAGTIANDPPASGSTPAPSPNQITISDGNSPIQPSDQSVSDVAGFESKSVVQTPSLLGDFVVDFDGSKIHCSAGDNWNASDGTFARTCEGIAGTDNVSPFASTNLGFSVTAGNGTTQTVSTAGVGETTTQQNTGAFSPAVTNANSLAITSMFAFDNWPNPTTNASENSTEIKISFPGPQLSVPLAPLSGATNTSTTPASALPTVDLGFGQTGLPSCTAILVFSEVTCFNLVPGTGYTVSNGSASGSFTVPAATAFAHQNPGTPIGFTPTPMDYPSSDYQALFVPSEGGAVLSGLAAGQTVTLSQSGRTLATIKVAALKFTSIRPLGDLLNGANGTTAGTCSPNLLVDFNSLDFCGSGGTIPSPNGLGDVSGLTEGNPIGTGETQVFLPGFENDPLGQTSIFTPFNMTAMLRYNDPITGSGGINDDNTANPDNGPTPVLPSTMSTDPVVFSYATLNPQTGATGAWVTLGNINVVGGLTLSPALPVGWYADQYTTTDTNGDSRTTQGEFYNQGSTTVLISPAACTAKVKGGGLKKATIAKAKKKKKKVSKTVTVTFSCTGTSGSHVALWIQRGSTVVADGSGTLKGGKAKILASATSGLKKGTYKLIEVTNSNGHSVEADHTLTLK
jgi:hypothetical protein